VGSHPTPDNGVDANSVVDARSVEADVEAILEAFRLREVHRYSWQRYWLLESAISDVAERLTARKRLENVAEHSWHVADIVLLLGGHFAGLNVLRACALATLHDKLEIFTGDFSPIGPDGTAAGTHFGDVEARTHKRRVEQGALKSYLERLSQNSRVVAEDLFAELDAATSAESRFVKAVDKLQALAYVVAAKSHLPAKHFEFTVSYSNQALTYFPGLRAHVEELQHRLAT